MISQVSFSGLCVFDPSQIHLSTKRRGQFEDYSDGNVDDDDDDGGGGCTFLTFNSFNSLLLSVSMQYLFLLPLLLSIICTVHANHIDKTATTTSLMRLFVCSEAASVDIEDATQHDQKSIIYYTAYTAIDDGK